MKQVSIITFFIFSLISPSLFSQNEDNNISIQNRTISIAMPFLQVPGDARSSGMGDIGVATPTDIYSQQWNAAKYAFAKEKQGIGLSYIPYLRKLTNDINVGQLNYYNRINERSTFAGSLRYFNLGEVDARETPHEPGIQLKPNQFSLDLSYALRLSETFSMGITGRYLRSDLKLQTSFDDASAANSFSVDISGFFESNIQDYKKFSGRWRAGASLSNIGPKINYGNSDYESFIPTNLSIGGGYEFILDTDHSIGTYVEFNKLLVPTPYDSNYDGRIDHNDDYHNKGPIEGIFTSFYDAPGGFSEELKEITWALGAEYNYQNKFSFRTGYFHESPDKGYRNYLTLGAGFKYSLAEFNLSYLFSTGKTVNNALDRGLRISLAFKFGGSR